MPDWTSRPRIRMLIGSTVIPAAFTAGILAEQKCISASVILFIIACGIDSAVCVMWNRAMRKAEDSSDAST